MNFAMAEALWDILESEACEQYYIDNAEKPAFLLLSKWNPLSHGAFELYMNSIGSLGKFKTKTQAIEHLKEVMRTAKKPLSFFKVDKFGRKSGKKRLFAKADGKGSLEIL
jgi:hypothetical protein